MTQKELSFTYRLLLVSVLVLTSVFVYSVGEYSIDSNVVGDFTVTIRTLLVYSNSSATIVEGSTPVDAGNGINITFDAVANSTGFLNVNFTDLNPANSTVSGKSAVGKYATVTTDLVFSNATIYFNYTDDNVASLDESSLQVYRFNETTTVWDALPGSVDTGANLVSGQTNHFSRFGVFGDTAEDEEEEEEPGGGDTGGGSGGGAGGLRRDFTITPDIITLSLVQGRKETIMVSLSNTGEQALSLELSLDGLSEVAALRTDTLFLREGESAVAGLDIFALEGTAPGIYAGKLIVDAGSGLRKTVNAVVQVLAREALFDVQVIVPPDYKTAYNGDDILARVILRNIGLQGTAVDVSLQLSLMDFDQTTVFESVQETLAVENVVDIQRIIGIPSTLDPGTYVLVARVDYPGASAYAFDTFTVEAHAIPFSFMKPSLKLADLVLVACIAVLIAIIVALLTIPQKKRPVSHAAQKIQHNDMLR